jgi:hypothetical protein
MRYREGTDKDCHGSQRFRTFTLDRAVEREKDVVGHLSLAADVNNSQRKVSIAHCCYIYIFVLFHEKHGVLAISIVHLSYSGHRNH